MALALDAAPFGAVGGSITAGVAGLSECSAWLACAQWRKPNAAEFEGARLGKARGALRGSSGAGVLEAAEALGALAVDLAKGSHRTVARADAAAPRESHGAESR